jgi:hypothetical protein
MNKVTPTVIQYRPKVMGMVSLQIKRFNGIITSDIEQNTYTIA